VGEFDMPEELRDRFELPTVRGEETTPRGDPIVVATVNGDETAFRGRRGTTGSDIVESVVGARSEDDVLVGDVGRADDEVKVGDGTVVNVKGGVVVPSFGEETLGSNNDDGLRGADIDRCRCKRVTFALVADAFIPSRLYA
jgi:hypothetical protein